MTISPSPLFWLRWAWRDLRDHWVGIIVIATVIAIGTGVYAGLTNTSTWRELSYDASYSTTRLHDLRVATPSGGFVDGGRLTTLVESTPSAAAIAHITERLVVDSQIVIDRDTPVTARLVGGTLDPDSVDRVVVLDGSLPAADSDAAVLETKFAEYRELPPSGSFTMPDGTPVDHTGVGLAPEEFFITTPEGTVMAEADLATVYLDLDTAQRLTARSGLVNELVLTVEPGTDVDAIADEIRTAADIAGLAVDVTDVDDIDSHRILYQDIDNDQMFFTMFAGLVLVAAGLAAFTLVNRIVEAQRREIGIGMALGAGRASLAVRPLAIGTSIAALGIVVGLGSGWLMARAMQGLLEDVLPLPDYRTPFQFGPFARAAGLGAVIPLTASIVPVWRAVRVEPVEAITTGHRTRSGRPPVAGRHLRLPLSSIAMMPVRQTLRGSRRTALTSLGVGIAVAALVSVFGMLDSFTGAIAVADRDLTRGGPDRVIVELDEVMRRDDPRLEAITDSPSVGRADLGFRVPATTVDGETPVDLLIDVYDFDTALWTPGTATDGLVISRKAAADLGVAPGNLIDVRHPVISADGVGVAASSVRITAVHDNPVRALAYIDDDSAADLIGSSGLTNIASVTPAEGASDDDIVRGLLGADGVASTFPVSRMAEAVDEALSTFTGFLVIIAAAVIGLAVLIALNASRIALDERRRDHATMRAFGLPVRTITATLVAEGVVVGLLATMIGLAIGTLMLDWLLGSLADRTLREFSITRRIAGSTIGWSTLAGLAAVALAPLLLTRRLRRMDIPSTLRVME
jgi:putative ABC transport system permease protein